MVLRFTISQGFLSIFRLKLWTIVLFVEGLVVLGTLLSIQFVRYSFFFNFFLRNYCANSILDFCLMFDDWSFSSITVLILRVIELVRSEKNVLSMKMIIVVNSWKKKEKRRSGELLKNLTAIFFWFYYYIFACLCDRILLTGCFLVNLLDEDWVQISIQIFG